MSNRLTKITTKKGDKGMTSIANGDKLAKSEARIEAIGAIDELNAVIGLLVASLQANAEFSEIKSDCRKIQQWLFDIGGDLAVPSGSFLDEKALAFLDGRIDLLNQSLPPLKEFVIPGEDLLSSASHFARTVARRAERRVVALQRQDENLSEEVLSFINRLSDYFFVVSRILARAKNDTEVQWRGSQRSEKNL